MKLCLLVALSFSLITFADYKASPVFKDGSDVIWGFDFLNNDQIIFTERDGKLWIYDQKKKKKSEVTGLPKIKAYGQGGLLDILVLKEKEETFLYFTYAKEIGESINTAFARAKLKEGQLKDVKDLFVSKVNSDERYHFGSRIILKDNQFYLTLGDRGQRKNAQDLSNHNGTIVRINKDGSIPKDNPFKDKGLDSIWSYGHRNPQGIDIDPVTKKIWSVEFGPRGGDELNLIRGGINYGWPVITYGKEYWGPSIGDTHKKGMEQPVKHYVPSISPSGMAFYVGDKIEEWRNDLFVAALGSQFLLRLKIKDDKVVEEKRYFEDLNERIRQVRNGPDGYLYFSTDSGKIFKVIK
ncbi:MAG: PQQ-dependent sugar dehydrogenase [Bdellovibrionota bacterium]|nr:PQQ-dependent sugar dehydrogenase [Bdellovibrionota bacterium]